MLTIRKRCATATLSDSWLCAARVASQVKRCFLVLHLRFRSSGSTGGIGSPSLLVRNRGVSAPGMAVHCNAGIPDTTESLRPG
jgi:hypothetical protein